MHDAAIPDDAGADDGLATRPLNLSERTPSEVERQVMGVSAESSLDELCAALDASDWLLARAKTIDRLMKRYTIHGRLLPQRQMPQRAAGGTCRLGSRGRRLQPLHVRAGGSAVQARRRPRPHRLHAARAPLQGPPHRPARQRRPRAHPEARRLALPTTAPRRLISRLFRRTDRHA